MSSPIGSLADALVAYVDANKTAILALAAGENLSISSLVESTVLALVQKDFPALYPFLQGSIKGAGPQIITFLGGEEAALFAVVDAALHTEATKLGG
jgi:hypothetical protein